MINILIWSHFVGEESQQKTLEIEWLEKPVVSRFFCSLSKGSGARIDSPQKCLTPKPRPEFECVAYGFCMA